MTQSRRVEVVIGVGLALRIGIALWNGLDGPSLGATEDALNFHRFAVAFTQGTAPPRYDLTGFTYAYALGYVYKITGPSLLIGSLLSCLAWLGSALLLKEAMRVLGAGVSRQFIAQVIYAVLPSSILWTSVTLREPYQLLCVNGMLLAGAHLLKKPTRSAVVLLLVSIGIGALLHAAVLILGAVVIGTLAARFCWQALKSPLTRMVAVLLVAAIAAGGGTLAFRTMYQKYSFKGGLAGAMQLHLSVGMRQQSRTQYLDDPTIKGVSGLVPAVATLSWKYLFEPLPWKANHWFDAGYLTENLLRVLLIGSAVVCLIRVPAPQRGYVAMLLLWYFGIELMWAVGTFNWGTAARHHLAATGLLLTAALTYDPRPYPLTMSSHRSAGRA